MTTESTPPDDQPVDTDPIPDGIPVGTDQPSIDFPECSIDPEFTIDQWDGRTDEHGRDIYPGIMTVTGEPCDYVHILLPATPGDTGQPATPPATDLPHTGLADHGGTLVIAAAAVIAGITVLRASRRPTTTSSDSP